MTEMAAVAPAVGEKIGGANRKNHATIAPNVVVGNFKEPSIPADFITPCGSMVFPRDLERITEHTRRVVVVVAGGVAIAPSGERFPTEWNDDLFAPIGALGSEPLLLNAAVVAIKAELPRPIQIEPIIALNGAALTIRARILRARIYKLRRHKSSWRRS